MSVPPAGFLRDLVVWSYSGLSMTDFVVTERFTGIYIPSGGPGADWIRDWLYRWLRDREVPPWHRVICENFEVPDYGNDLEAARAVADACQISYGVDDDPGTVCAAICTGMGWVEPPAVSQ